MRIGLHLPSADVPILEWRIEKRIAGLQLRFGPEAQVALIGAPDHPSREGPSASFPLLASPHDCEAEAWFAEAPPPPGGTRGWRVLPIGRVIPLCGTRVSAAEHPQLGAHAFNENGPQGGDDADYYGFQYFPFGYTFRLLGLGPIDPFGHRIAGDLRKLKGRASSHKLVACLGGSAVWGTTVLPEFSFPAKLEQALRSAAPKPDDVTVLNFGVPGAVLLNTIQQFVLHVADLRPDVVIFHDGANDLFYACTADPRLVVGYAITYQQNMERWAEVLHQPEKKNEPTALGGPVVPPRDPPPLATLKAYLRRKREAVTIAQAFGAKVVSGLQPISESKSRLSPRERARISASSGSPPSYATEFLLISQMYRQIQTHNPGFGAEVNVNFDTVFRSLPADDSHFWDRVHLDDDGEAAVARVYAQAVTRLLWPTPQ